ncbi:Protein kinase protein with adenine nucleotide alpha hydrolase-like domain [Zea mays]|uniref:Protein kinase protein with adenine nucleotide alpha hydrolase-like domain n=1 Tax=Zea mays TaxID=4577 RepID=A0A1D6QCL1_MAIZE|nr:Protein kinase protein with adenine nucleotide alpha hydrolase-like domain [Zea mays]
MEVQLQLRDRERI